MSKIHTGVHKQVLHSAVTALVKMQWQAIEH